MVKICIILICAKKIFFGKIICSTHQRKCFSTILHNFWKIEFLKEYQQARTLQKWWKYVYLCRKYFLAKAFVPLISTILQFLENWIFEGISTGADLTKMVKIWTILQRIFFVKIICSTQFSTILRENWIFEGISTGADLTKMVKICIILICAKKIFFGKIICSTHQRKCFSTILGKFWKIEFLKEYRQARTLQKWWTFELS